MHTMMKDKNGFIVGRMELTHGNEDFVPMFKDCSFAIALGLTSMLNGGDQLPAILIDALAQTWITQNE